MKALESIFELYSSNGIVSEWLQVFKDNISLVEITDSYFEIRKDDELYALKYEEYSLSYFYTDGKIQQVNVYEIVDFVEYYIYQTKIIGRDDYFYKKMDVSSYSDNKLRSFINLDIVGAEDEDFFSIEKRMNFDTGDVNFILNNYVDAELIAEDKYSKMKNLIDGSDFMFNDQYVEYVFSVFANEFEYPDMQVQKVYPHKPVYDIIN